MLITLPDHDTPTRYISAWVQKIVIPVAERNNIVPHILKGKAVTKSKITEILTNETIQFASFNGHGDDKTITGYDYEPLITFGENHDLIKGKIVHAFACNSGKVLGKKCKSKAFIGYDNSFMLVSDYMSETRPLKDKFATPIINCALEVPLQLVKKKTAKEAYEKSQETYQKMIDEYTISSSKYTTEELYAILPVLLWNKKCQVRHGELSAKIQ